MSNESSPAVDENGFLQSSHQLVPEHTASSTQPPRRHANPSFALRFAEAWKSPTSERIVRLLQPDAVLLQLHLPAIRGKAAALREFRRLFRWLPTSMAKLRNRSEMIPRYSSNGA